MEIEVGRQRVPEPRLLLLVPARSQPRHSAANARDDAGGPRGTMSRRVARFFPLPARCNVSGLVAEARALADRCLRVRGSVPPTLMAITPRGLLVYGPDSTADENEKEAFALECRLLVVAGQAVVCAMILEAWMTDVVNGKIPARPPSASPHRKEVVMICAESRKAQRSVILPIRRTPPGRFTVCV
jgi:hypothetical protein